MTPEDARLIMEAHEIQALLDNDEEVELLEQNNPELLTAYEALVELATSDSE